jgi:uncharacterized protein (TIGR00369 family)
MKFTVISKAVQYTASFYINVLILIIVFRLGNLHGGCVATLIDICSSFAIFVAEGKTWNLAGVSTDLSVSYLRGVPEGETITLVCEVARVGKALANIHTKVYDNENRLCYAGTHTKFNIDSRM